MTPQTSDNETRKIPENELEEFFTNFTKKFLRDSNNRIDLEVLGGDLGDQFEAQNSGIFGITYEPNEKALEFELQAGDHRIMNPKEVWVVADTDGFIKSIEIVTQDGTRQVATVKRGTSARPDRPSSEASAGF